MLLSDSLVDVHHDSSVPSIQDNDTALAPTPTSTFISTSCTPRISGMAFSTQLFPFEIKSSYKVIQAQTIYHFYLSDINPKPSLVYCEQAYRALDPLVLPPTLIVLKNDGTGSCLSGVTDFFDGDETGKRFSIKF